MVCMSTDTCMRTSVCFVYESGWKVVCKGGDRLYASHVTDCGHVFMYSWCLRSSDRLWTCIPGVKTIDNLCNFNDVIIPMLQSLRYDMVLTWGVGGIRGSHLY
ncbi:unnamed protein product [Lymnaea stagnalis]|uniref:Uncharacterized protein n=1 Tax=Lymnaea stagnalis TaxID=6523 RepID=A0AAV2HA21_LYMST